MIHRTTYAIYGLRVSNDADRDLLDEELGHCLNDGRVGWIHLGAHDRHDIYLINSWDTLEPGQAVFHSGEHPNADRFERIKWNDDLRDAADRLNLTITGEPGWYTLPSEA